MLQCDAPLWFAGQKQSRSCWGHISECPISEVISIYKIQVGEKVWKKYSRDLFRGVNFSSKPVIIFLVPSANFFPLSKSEHIGQNLKTLKGGNFRKSLGIKSFMLLSYRSNSILFMSGPVQKKTPFPLFPPFFTTVSEGDYA